MAWDPLLALEFLTVLRIRRWRPVAPQSLARAQAFYPLVGLLLGAGLVLFDALLGGLLPAGPRAAVLVAALAVVTRGLHLDGLADTFDGLLGGRNREQRLEIMRDPRTGSFGTAAIALLLLIEWSAIAALTSPARRPGLLLIPALARYAIVVTSAAVPYAREHGLGAGYHAAAREAPLLVATGTAAVAGVAVFGPAGLVLMALAAGSALAVAAWSRARIGGATGDVYGATCALTEALLWLAVVAAQTRGWADPWLVRG